MGKRTALIAGAGIGGLSAAIALRQAGWNIRLFERAATARELGFGLGVPPNAIAALRRLGVADVVLARGFAPTRGELRRVDGTVLKRAELPAAEVLGGPMVVALRSALHGALLEAIGLDAITFGSEVTGFTADGDRVAVRTASGDTAEGDLLIGADGVRSVIRRALHPSEPPPRRVSSTTVGRLLHRLGYRLQSVRKRQEGTVHPDRNEQFEHINATADRFLNTGQPVISVDTKKKELVGNGSRRRRRRRCACTISRATRRGRRFRTASSTGPAMKRG